LSHKLFLLEFIELTLIIQISFKKSQVEVLSLNGYQPKYQEKTQNG